MDEFDEYLSDHDDFDDYLKEALKNTKFRKAFERAQRRPVWRRRLIALWDKRPFRRDRNAPTEDA